jgi:hypothetical protein
MISGAIEGIMDCRLRCRAGGGVCSPHIPARPEDRIADTGAAEAVAEAHPRAAMMFAMSVA